MDISNLLLLAVVPLVCILSYTVSRYLIRKEDSERDSANCLIVLSGMLAALAILIPLGTGLLPEKDMSVRSRILEGALLAGVICTFGIIYSMISLQSAKTFKPTQAPGISSWINATWIALGVLALSCVGVKLLPTVREVSHSVGQPDTHPRFAVGHSLPELGTDRQSIETEWGIPAIEDGTGLVYITEDGAIIFCLDGSGASRSIIETRENYGDAFRSSCK